jgi:uncharacterized protein YkwD
MKIIRKLFEWIILLLIGFFIGINVDNLMDARPSRIDDILFPSEPAQTEVPAAQSDGNEEVHANNSEVDYDTIENNIIQSVNELREELGAPTVTVNETLREGAYIRAKEIEESFSHTRPDGSEPFSVFSQEGLEYNYGYMGENLAMVTYFGNDQSMSQVIFEGWVDSPDHYETMIDPDFKEIGVGVHFDGDILYATQFFGTER